VIWATADQHWNHGNILQYANRPFGNIAEMNATLISNHNSVVNNNDDIYMLGDVTLGSYNTFLEFINQLKGKIHIIPGSHDWQWMKGFSKDSTERSFVVLEPIHILEFKNDTPYPEMWVLCHYAMRKWCRSHFGTYHLYGHSHCQLSDFGRSTDVGVDCWNHFPVSLDTLREKFLQVPAPKL